MGCFISSTGLLLFDKIETDIASDTNVDSFDDVII